MHSHIGGFTSKSNKCFISAWYSVKCSRLRISAHNTNLSSQLKNLAPKIWISQREVEDQTSLVDRTCFRMGLTDMTGVQYQSDRLDNFSTLLEFGFLILLLKSLYILSTLVFLRSSCCITLYSTMTYTQEWNKTFKNKLEVSTWFFFLSLFHLCQSLRVSTCSWLE
jgi:hypothetical protein